MIFFVLSEVRFYECAEEGPGYQCETMAPFLGPSRKKVLKILSGFRPEKSLPITLGLYSPMAVILFESDTYQLVELVMDEKAARKEGERRLADGQDWMPEMTWQFLKRGRPLLKTASLKDFIEGLKKISVEFWED